jgi:hypothetical protein
LGISDFDRERICINTLGNFRSRLYEYAEAQGRDLLGEEISRLTDALIDISGMDTRLARQDFLDDQRQLQANGPLGADLHR